MRSPFFDRLLNFGPLVLALGVLAATVFYHLSRSVTQSSSGNSGVTAPAATPTVPTADAASDLHAVPGWHLFGAASTSTDMTNPPQPTPPDALSDLPPASVDLKLNGIAYSEDPLRAYAIIASADGLQKKYRSGDTVTPEVVIHKIKLQSVVISHQGKFEALSLPVESLPRDPTLAVAPTAPQNPYLAQLRLTRPPAPRALPRPPPMQLPAIQAEAPVEDAADEQDTYEESGSEDYE